MKFVSLFAGIGQIGSSLQHKHVSPANHSREQSKLFFSLANQLNDNVEQVKRRVKRQLFINL